MCKSQFNLLNIVSKTFDLFIITETDLQMMDGLGEIPRDIKEH